VRDLLRASPEELVSAFRLADETKRVEVYLQLRPSERTILFQRLPDEMLASLIARADSASVVEPLAGLGAERTRSLIVALNSDDLLDLLRRLPPEFQNEVLSGLPEEGQVRQLLRYPEGTVGSIAIPRTVSIPEVVTVARALDLVRQAAREESLHYLYVVDSGGKLSGTLSVRNLLVASPRAVVRDLVAKELVKVSATATHAELAEAFRTHDYLALPVVDERDRLIGVVTAEDVVGTLQEEQDRLVYGVTGVDPREHLVAGLRAARGRLPWITVTILGGLGCAVIGTVFQKSLRDVVVLALFIPLVLAIGESVGTQTAAIVMKTLVTGAVRPTQLASFLGKELVIGLLLGLFAGALVGALSKIWDLRGVVAPTIGAAVFVSAVWASILGVTIPLLLRRWRVEPSVASGPVVLLLCDFSTLMIYLGGAELILL